MEWQAQRFDFHIFERGEFASLRGAEQRHPGIHDNLVRGSCSNETKWRFRPGRYDFG
jgi:hypothetical protein